MHENEIKKCIHCGAEYKKEDLQGEFTYKYNNYEISDYICPGCGKVMNGCESITCNG